MIYLGLFIYYWLNSCGSGAQWLHSMWEFPGPGIDPSSPALTGRFLIPESPERSQKSLRMQTTWWNLFVGLISQRFHIFNPQHVCSCYFEVTKSTRMNQTQNLVWILGQMICYENVFLTDEAFQLEHYGLPTDGNFSACPDRQHRKQLALKSKGISCQTSEKPQ